VVLVLAAVPHVVADDDNPAGITAGVLPRHRARAGRGGLVDIPEPVSGVEQSGDETTPWSDGGTVRVATYWAASVRFNCLFV
jgi:hypothetical protein